MRRRYAAAIYGGRSGPALSGVAVGVRVCPRPRAKAEAAGRTAFSLCDSNVPRTRARWQWDVPPGAGRLAGAGPPPQWRWPRRLRCRRCQTLPGPAPPADIHSSLTAQGRGLRPLLPLRTPPLRASRAGAAASLAAHPAAPTAVTFNRLELAKTFSDD
jgi:hypothetical protein